MKRLTKQISKELKNRRKDFDNISEFLNYISQLIETEPNSSILYRTISIFKSSNEEWLEAFEHRVSVDNIENSYYNDVLNIFEIVAKYEASKAYFYLQKMLPEDSKYFITFPDSNDPKIDPNYHFQIKDFLYYIEQYLAQIELIETGIISSINDYLGEDRFAYRVVVWIKNLFPKNPEFDELYDFSLKHKSRKFNLKIGYCETFGQQKDVFSIIRKSGNKYFLQQDGTFYEINCSASEEIGCLIGTLPNEIDKNILELFIASYIMNLDSTIKITLADNPLQILKLTKSE